MPASKTSDTREKLYYKINEVSKITGEAAYVLRYWESVFPQLKPSKDENGVRLYRKADIELIQEIKRLRVQEGFTLEGVKKQLQGAKKASKAPAVEQAVEENEESAEAEAEKPKISPVPHKTAIARQKSSEKKSGARATSSFRKELRAIRTDIQSLIAEMEKSGA